MGRDQETDGSSTLLAETTSEGFNACVLISFIESPWPTKLYKKESIIVLMAGYHFVILHGPFGNEKDHKLPYVFSRCQN